MISISRVPAQAALFSNKIVLTNPDDVILNICSDNNTLEPVESLLELANDSQAREEEELGVLMQKFQIAEGSLAIMSTPIQKGSSVQSEKELLERLEFEMRSSSENESGSDTDDDTDPRTLRFTSII